MTRKSRIMRPRMHLFITFALLASEPIARIARIVAAKIIREPPMTLGNMREAGGGPLTSVFTFSLCWTRPSPLYKLLSACDLDHIRLCRQRANF